MQLTRDQLEATITNVSGTTFAELVTVTVASLTGGKKNPMQGRVKKHVEQNVQIGASYENGVNRQGAREGKDTAGDFVAQSLPWGKWHVKNKLIENKGKLYLRYTCQPHMTPSVSYTLDGEAIDKGAIEGLKPSRKSATQEGFADREIVPRTVALENIRAIKVKGTNYNIV